MTESNDVGSEDLRAVAHEFLGILGLPEIVLGAFALFLISRTPLAADLHLFTSTQIGLIDLGLSIAAAALIGKIITFVVAFVMGAIALGIQLTPYHELLRELSDAIAGRAGTKTGRW